MTTFEIDGKPIGGDAPVFIIAELSANHGGRLDIALQTIEAAARVGADAIKLQTYTPDTLTLRSSAPHFVVKSDNAWAGRTLHDLYAEAMTPWEWHQELRAAAHAHGLAFFSTPFDATAVEFLEQVGVGAHKIASFELGDLPLVEHVARRGKPMILSTGMASLAEISAAVSVCRDAGNDRLALLRCVSSYPARPDQMDLRSFELLRGFGTVVGLSDHTRDSTVAIASVALGAKLIEKHFILDRTLGGPDSFFSLDPDDFRSMVTSVRSTEAALGRVRFGPGPDERKSVAFRRSLFVARDITAGETLTCDNVRSVRPSTGLAPEHLPLILGRQAATAMAAGTPVAWSLVGERSTARVTLRRATRDDAALLRAWRNDDATRAMSLSTELVSEATHTTWLDATLSSEMRRLFVATAEGALVGQVRLDDIGAGALELSLTVAPEARGRGLGADLLLAAEDEARDLGADILIARIKEANDRSVSVFKRAGYYAFVSRGGVLQCERRLNAYGAR